MLSDIGLKFQKSSFQLNLNPGHGEVFSIQHYVIKFVSDLRQVGGFLRVLWFPPPIKLTATEILLKLALNTINHQTNLLFIFSETIFVMELLNDRNVQTLHLTYFFVDQKFIAADKVLTCET